MKTVSDSIREEILDTPFLEEGLAQGLVNLSALARKLRPAIEKDLLKPVSQAAILMALRRLVPTLSLSEGALSSPLELIQDFTVRSDLVEHTYVGSRSLTQALTVLIDQANSGSHRFVTFTQGVFEVTVIMDARIEQEAKRILGNETLIASLDGLAAVTLRFPREIVGTPGVHYSILKQLAMRSINVIEVVSTYTELTIILESHNVERAFQALLRR